MATHSSTLAWTIPWMKEPGGLQSMGSLRVGHDWATSLSLFTFMHWRRKWKPTPVFLLQSNTWPENKRVLESSGTKFCSGGNGPTEPTCLKTEQTLLAFQISACISIEKLINSHQLEENYVNLMCIKYVFVSVSQSSSEFSVLNFTSLSLNLCVITQ